MVKAERLENARTKRIDRCERSASSQFSLPIDPASSWFVDRDMPLGVCVTTMVEKNVASVLVTGRVLPGIRGIFSERDYLLKVAATDEDPRELTVGDVMSTRALLSAARPRTIRVWLRESFVKLAFWRGKCG